MRERERERNLSNAFLLVVDEQPKQTVLQQNGTWVINKYIEKKKQDDKAFP